MTKDICVVSPSGVHWYLTPLTSELMQSEPVKPLARQPLWVCAVLEEAGFSVSYLPFHDLYPTSCDPAAEKHHLSQVKSPVLLICPELLTSTTTYYNCGRIAHLHKEAHPSGKVVLSGEHASTLPEAALTELEVDVIAPFELLLNKEVAIPLVEELLQGKDPSVEGVFFKGSDGRIHQQPPVSPVVEDLSALPPPRYELLLPYFKEISRGCPAWINLVTSRGCPFTCAYCSSVPSPEFRRVRYLSCESVQKEIDKIRKAFKKDIFWEAIYDEFYAYNLEHVTKMNTVFTQEDITFSLVFGRCTHFTPDIAEILQHHTKGIIFGAESCNQASLDIIRKNQTFNQVLAALKTAKKHNLTTVLQWIVGLPAETISSMYRTLATINRLYTSGLTDRVDIQMLVPFPWTDMYKHPEKFGITIMSELWNEYNELGYYPVYCTDTLTRDQIWTYFLYANLTNIYGKVLRKHFKRDLYSADTTEINQYFEEKSEDVLKSAFLRELIEKGGIKNAF